MSVDIVWLKDDDYYDSWVCKQHKVLLSSARAVEDGKLDENGNPYTYLGKDKKMGANTWDVDEPYNCPETGISVHVKVGRVPTHKNVENTTKKVETKHTTQTHIQKIHFSMVLIRWV